MFGIEPSKVIVDFSNFEASQFLDALVYGGAMLLIGMLTVFAVLCLLWIFLVLFKIFFHDLPAKKHKKPEAATQTATIQEAVASTADDSEIIAVIAAAIAMAESESSGTQFRVVSFKRK